MESLQPSHADTPPSPATSDDTMQQNPAGLVAHVGNRRPHTRLRCVPTRSCSMLLVSVIIMLTVLGFAAGIIFFEVGDPSWAYGTIGAILAVAIVNFKNAITAEKALPNFGVSTV